MVELEGISEVILRLIAPRPCFTVLEIDFE